MRDYWGSGLVYRRTGMQEPEHHKAHEVPRSIDKNGIFFLYLRVLCGYFLPFFEARSCKALVTTRNISSHGAGFPVQISNWRAA
jgi:hypothetical protein